MVRKDIDATVKTDSLKYIDRAITYLELTDTVTVGDVHGTVTRIRIRATTIEDWDRKELIVPNKEFITGRLINWSPSDNIIRIKVPIGIAYGSDGSG